MTTKLVMRRALAWVSPALGAKTHCTTSTSRPDRWYTLCDDGTRAVSRYKRVLNRWMTIITVSLSQSWTVRVNPGTKQMEVRCR